MTTMPDTLHELGAAMESLDRLARLHLFAPLARFRRHVQLEAHHKCGQASYRVNEDGETVMTPSDRATLDAIRGVMDAQCEAIGAAWSYRVREHVSVCKCGEVSIAYCSVAVRVTWRRRDFGREYALGDRT